MKDFEIPTLDEYLDKAKKVWVQVSNSKKESANRLILMFGTSDYNKYIELQTDIYNHTFTKGKAFAKKQIEGSIAHHKVAIERLDESKKNHDKAMSFSQDKQEQEIENAERKVRKITGKKKIF